MKISWRIPVGGHVILLKMSDTDLELLGRYTWQHAEDAFAELVRRQIDLVHSAALRCQRAVKTSHQWANQTQPF